MIQDNGNDSRMQDNDHEDIEDDEDDESDEELIIEERNTQVKYSGEYAPYFPNATIFMLFTWCTKHMIGMLYNYL